MSQKIDLSAYETMWTTEFQDYVLVEHDHEGQAEYNIYHLPTKMIVLIDDDAEYQAIIRKMLAMKSRIVSIDEFAGMM